MQTKNHFPDYDTEAINNAAVHEAEKYLEHFTTPGASFAQQLYLYAIEQGKRSRIEKFARPV